MSNPHRLMWKDSENNATSQHSNLWVLLLPTIRPTMRDCSAVLICPNTLPNTGAACHTLPPTCQGTRDSLRTPYTWRQRHGHQTYVYCRRRVYESIRPRLSVGFTTHDNKAVTYASEFTNSNRKHTYRGINQVRVYISNFYYCSLHLPACLLFAARFPLGDKTGSVQQPPPIDPRDTR